MGWRKLEYREKPLLNITMVLALEPSVGTVESARLTSAPLLPLLSSAQAAGVRFGDRQTWGWSLVEAGCLGKHLLVG